ncbi:S-adenosyl-L-methionine-dependent methyltransferase [Apodospora peruviana]|uniref:S-adenosyl-L-methionine-dependent methyltransferase n=1 Tax=Apodospora peruviana TaxID=516989 RepID=A0AAE0I761_9PEZI|nr:S-adenosyl-L-methionine-dependent methyltransferase [Apodospora peruviana]
MPAHLTTPSLVDLAKEILKAATTLQEQLDKANVPQPDLSSHGPQNYHGILDNALALEARSDLVEAARTMVTLAQGPVEVLRSMVLVDHNNLAVLIVIHELKIAEVVPLHGSISISDLAARVGVHPAPLARIMRFAYTMHMFCEPEGKPDFVEHTSLSAAIPPFDSYLWLTLGKNAKVNASKGEWSEAMDLRVWPCSPMTLVDGEKPGRDPWRIIAEAEEDGSGMDKFGEAMRVSMGIIHGAESLVKGFDWEELGRGAVVVDLGGGNGHNAVAIAKEFPNLKVVVQDLVENEGLCGELVRRELGLEEDGRRVVFQVHDFFEEQPPPPEVVVGEGPEGGEVKAYFLSRVLHDWSDEDAGRIVRQLVPGMRRGAKLFVVERLLPDRPGEIALHKEAMVRGLDLLMFTFFGEACERSYGQWEKLFRSVDKGLKILKWSTASEMSTLVVGFEE